MMKILQTAEDIRHYLYYNSLGDIIRGKCNAMNMIIEYDGPTCRNCLYNGGEWCTVVGVLHNRSMLESVVI